MPVGQFAMSVLVAPFLAAALLLSIAGVSKVLEPRPTLRAVESAGLPFRVTSSMVRTLGVAEFAVGGVALLGGGRIPALLVCLGYAGFALFVARGLLRGDLESCGCFSGDDAPPSVLHVAINVFLAVAALDVALAASPGVLGLFAEDTAVGAGVGAVTLLDAGVLYLVLTRMPRPDETVTPTVGEPAVDDDSLDLTGRRVVSA